MMKASQVAAAINPPDFYHSPLTTLVSIENTTNKGGGACWDLEELRKIKKVCKEHGLAYHLDGARLWNALVKTQESPKTYGQLFDTISVCLSKGLGCPVGSVLLGTEQMIQQALRIRKVFGGGMRQAGYSAAAGIYALDHHIERLGEDHQKAKDLSDTLSSLPWVAKVEPVETNIVIFEINTALIAEDKFLQRLKEKQIDIIGMGQGKLRMVTHLDYTQEQHAYVIHTLRNEVI
jgi:threonine aldolase